MPCPPGFVPVAKVDHATGVSAGEVVATRANPPCARSRRRFGSSPAASMPPDDLGLEPIEPDDDDALHDQVLPVGAALGISSHTHEGKGKVPVFEVAKSDTLSTFERLSQDQVVGRAVRDGMHGVAFVIMQRPDSWLKAARKA